MKTNPYKLIKTAICLILMLSCALPFYSATDRLSTYPLDSLTEYMDMPGSLMLQKADSAYWVPDNMLALSLYNLMVENGKDMGDLELMGAYRGLGHVMTRYCNYPGALNYYVAGLKICDTDNTRPEYREWAAEFYKNIGIVYCAINDYEQGIRYYKLALEKCDETTDYKIRCRILYNLAGFYTYVDNPVEARHHLKLASRIDHKGDPEYSFLNILIEGMTLRSEGKYKEAVTCMKKAGDFAAAKNCLQGICVRH